MSGCPSLSPTRSPHRLLKFSEVMQKLAGDVQILEGYSTTHSVPALVGHGQRSQIIKATDVSADLLCDSEAKQPSPEKNGSMSPDKSHGFPYQCPRDEGEAGPYQPLHRRTNEPSDPKWAKRIQRSPSATALIWRTRISGGTAESIGLVFARNSGFKNGNDRNLIIFEALVPNPSPPLQPTANLCW